MPEIREKNIELSLSGYNIIIDIEKNKTLREIIN
jgi:HSP20 family molecular chaperone IbpA